MLEIVPIPYEEKTVLYHLIQFYRYDSSEFDGHALTGHGVYLYKYLDHQWTEEFRRPFFLKVDGELAGFVLVMLDVPKEYVKVSTADRTNVISDFFVMRKFRNRGYGKRAAFHIFDRLPGTWEIRQTARNIPARTFWNKVIREYTGESVHRNDFKRRALERSGASVRDGMQTMIDVFYSRQVWGWGNFDMIGSFKFLAYHTANCGEQHIGAISEHDENCLENLEEGK